MVATYAVFGCMNSRKNCPGLSFHRIPTANAENKLLRQRRIQNVHRADPLLTISKKIASNETLRCVILYLHT